MSIRRRSNLRGLDVQLMREEELLNQLQDLQESMIDEPKAFYMPEAPESKETNKKAHKGEVVRRASRLLGMRLSESKAIFQELDQQKSESPKLKTARAYMDGPGFRTKYLREDFSEDDSLLNSRQDSSVGSLINSEISSSQLDYEASQKESPTPQGPESTLDWGRKLQTVLAGDRKKHEQNYLAMSERLRGPTIEDLSVLPPQDRTWSKPPWSLDIYDMVGTLAFEYIDAHKRTLPENILKANCAIYSSINFRLPLVLSHLEGYSVRDYLVQYCKVCKERNYVYQKMFSEYGVKARQNVVAMMRKSASDLLFGFVNTRILDEYIGLLDLDEGYVIKETDYTKFLALCDRLYAINVEEIGQERWNYQADTLERIDFRNIAQRLEGLALQPALITLLKRISDIIVDDPSIAQRGLT
ncbi:hypothetical protein AAHC03_09858 [Spirometra sp. Aus1]